MNYKEQIELATRIIRENKERKRNEKEKRQYWKNPYGNSIYQRCYKYGISVEEYYRLLAIQDGNCAICGATFNEPRLNGKKFDRSTSIHVDHDHISGKVRGLLCSNCNVALGMLRDDPELIRRAIDYIKEFKIMSELTDSPFDTRGESTVRISTQALERRILEEMVILYGEKYRWLIRDIIQRFFSDERLGLSGSQR